MHRVHPRLHYIQRSFFPPALFFFRLRQKLIMSIRVSSMHEPVKSSNATPTMKDEAEGRRSEPAVHI